MNRTTLLSIYIYIYIWFFLIDKIKSSQVYLLHISSLKYILVLIQPQILRNEKKKVFFLFFLVHSKWRQHSEGICTGFAFIMHVMRLSLKQQKKVTGNSLNFRPFLEFPLQGSLDFRPFLPNTSINQQRIEILELRLVTRGERISPVM